jgi:DNA-directed RNA polymerase subunit delta
MLVADKRAPSAFLIKLFDNMNNLLSTSIYLVLLFIMNGMISNSVIYEMKGSADMSKLDSMPKEEIHEIASIDIINILLQEAKQPVSFYTLMDQVQQYKKLSEEEKKVRALQAYTDLNVDGRFVSLGDNQWGLKAWYPVEQTEEELATTIKPKKRRKKDDDDDDFDLVDEYDEDFDDLDEGDLDTDDLDDLDDEDLEDFDDDDFDEDEEDDDLEEEEEDEEL